MWALCKTIEAEPIEMSGHDIKPARQNQLRWVRDVNQMPIPKYNEVCSSEHKSTDKRRRNIDKSKKQTYK